MSETVPPVEAELTPEDKTAKAKHLVEEFMRQSAAQAGLDLIEVRCSDRQHDVWLTAVFGGIKVPLPKDSNIVHLRAEWSRVPGIVSNPRYGAPDFKANQAGISFYLGAQTNGIMMQPDLIIERAEAALVTLTPVES